jgi:cell division protein FtsB
MQSLSGDVSALKRQIAEQLSTEVSELRREVLALKTQIVDLGELKNDIGCLSGEVTALRSAAAGMRSLSGDVSALKTQIAEKLSTEVSELRREVSALKTQIAVLKGWSAAPDSQIFSDLHAQREDSRIISGFPEIFVEFRRKRFSLLWRGSRDGFAAQEFHRRCDGHPNTLTVILDTEGNIFGGFTPVEWESRVWNGRNGNGNNRRKADDSQKSFLFTLKNPHSVPARRFALNAEEKQRAIRCDSMLWE